MGTIRFNKEIRKTVFKLFPMIFSRLLVLVPVVVMSWVGINARTCMCCFHLFKAAQYKCLPYSNGRKTYKGRLT